MQAPVRLEHFSRRSRITHGVSAFSLVELLVVLAVGSLLFYIVGDLLLGQLEANTRLERLRKARVDFGRLIQFVDAEIGEAQSVAAGGSIPSSCGGGIAALTLVIPSSEGLFQIQSSGSVVTNLTSVFYYQRGGSLPAVYRCGPGIQSDGSLALGGTPVLAETKLIDAGSIQSLSATTSLAGKYRIAMNDAMGNTVLSRDVETAIRNRRVDGRSSADW